MTSPVLVPLWRSGRPSARQMLPRKSRGFVHPHRWGLSGLSSRCLPLHAFVCQHLPVPPFVAIAMPTFFSGQRFRT